MRRFPECTSALVAQQHRFDPQRRLRRGQWPILPLPALPFIPELPADDAAPISQAARPPAGRHERRQDVGRGNYRRALPDFRDGTAAFGRRAGGNVPLHPHCRRLDGGRAAVALDFAILLWVVPMVDRTSRNFADFKALLDEYPLSQAKL